MKILDKLIDRIADRVVERIEENTVTIDGDKLTGKIEGHPIKINRDSII